MNYTICYRHMQSKVSYKFGFFDHELIKIEDLHEEMGYCKNTGDYIKRFVEFLKECVIRKYKYLDAITFTMKTFDRNNIMHRLIVNVVDLLKQMLRIKDKIDLYESVVVDVYYGNKHVFTGQINFTGLFEK
jgi:hypothetical protein